MRLTQLNDGTGGKAGKFAAAAGLHVLMAMGLSLCQLAMSQGIAESGRAQIADVWTLE